MRKLDRLLRKETKWTQIKEFFEDLWWDYIEGPYHKYTQMWKRVFYYGWNMRWSWDFDAFTIYHMLSLKLDALYDVMLNHGHLVWNSNPSNNLMRKLNEARHLAKKLDSDFRYSRHYEAFSAKYKTQRDVDSDCVMKEFRDKRYPDAKVIDDKLHSFMIRKAFEKDAAEERADRQRLFFLLDKYIRQWWD